jgi:hypothetical protein
MTAKEMTIGVSRTFRHAQFESFRVEAAMTVSIEVGDDLDELRAKVLVEIRKSLSAAYKANYPR